MCEHLEAVTRGQIKKLIINIPPGMLKSSLVAVLWPTWEWTFRPYLRWLFATYTNDLTYRDSGRRKDVMQSRWYKERWGHKFRLTKEGDEYTKNNWTGHMFSTSTGGQTTGWRGDRLVLDDPQDPRGTESELKRESTIEWLSRTWPTRIDQGPHSAEVLVQQRLHESDATGLYLRQGGWELLKIPLQYNRKKYPTAIGWNDPRETAGDVISPEIYPPEKIVDLRKRLGPYGAAGQLDQEPAPPEGGIIKRAWVRHYEGPSPTMDGWVNLEEFQFRPMEHVRFCVVDPATTEQQTIKRTKQNDPDWFVLGAFAAVGSTRGTFIVLLDLDMGKWDGTEHETKVEAFHKKWKFSFIAVETFGFQLSLFQRLKKDKRLPVMKLSDGDPAEDSDIIARIDGDKASRVYAAAPLMADGRFWTPTYHPWLGEYLKQLVYFPNADHDDCVDVTTGAVAIGNTLRLAAVQPGQREKAERARRDDVLPPDQDRQSSPWDAIRVQNPRGRA